MYVRDRVSGKWFHSIYILRLLLKYCFSGLELLQMQNIFNLKIF